MAQSTLPESDLHVIWHAAWRDLRARYDRPSVADDPAIGDQIFELEELIANTPATTRDGVLVRLAERLGADSGQVCDLLTAEVQQQCQQLISDLAA